MAGTPPRLPEQFRGIAPDENFSVSELVSDAAPVLIAGSLYLAGEALAANDEPPA